MNDAKAIFATITSLTAAVGAWVSALEAVLRIGASIAAILAGLAATNELFAGLAKTNFVAGQTNYVIATSQDVSGIESEPSNEVWFVPPPPSRLLHLTMQESASVNGPWTDLPIPPVDVPMTETSRFYCIAGMELRTPE